jgi:folylpolyglutamate synthase/dihydropteroate synthase
VSDKDIRKMTAVLFPLACRIHLTPLNNARSAAPRDIAVMNARFKQRMNIYADAHEALQAAWQHCPRRGLVVVAGSLYLVGELLPAVRGSAEGLLRSR